MPSAAGSPFLVHLDGDGRQRLVELGDARLGEHRTLALDRRPLALGHRGLAPARVLEHEGGEWTIADEGLSRNGSFVNGHRLRGRRRLCDGDAIKIGGTLIVFVDANGDGPGPRPRRRRTLEPPQLSDAQLRVLVSLCGPLDDGPYAGPRSNREIADDLYLSVETVKTHLRALFDLFGIGELPQNRKRAELVRRAFESGVLG